MHIAQKFEALLEIYRRPDGRRWSGQQIDEATGGVVTRCYVTTLRKGRIESPGYEKMAAIAKAMGFPPEAWFEESIGTTPGRTDDRDRSITDRIEQLFDAIRNSSTGEPYTNAEVRPHDTRGPF
jgi:transcriptional regulator with XRE-family HTH domain